MFKLLKKYYHLNRAERKLLNQLLVWLIIGLFLARFVPLKWFDYMLGEYRKESLTDASKDQMILILKVKRKLKKIKKRVPWKVKCFEEAIAAKRVLEKYQVKTSIYLGVKKEKENKLIAHSWLKAGGIFITGKNGHEHYAVVGFYS